MGSTLGTSRSSSVLSASADVVPSTFVVPLDGSDLSLRAAPIASWFAERFDADVLAVTAPMTGERHDRTVLPAWLEELAADDRYPRLRASVADDDDPVSAVSALVAKHPNSAVCMGTHSHGALTANPRKVSRARGRWVGVPVLLVGGQCVEPLFDNGPIVVCHDGSLAADAILRPVQCVETVGSCPDRPRDVHDPLDVRPRRTATSIQAALEFLGSGTCLEMVADSFAAGAIRNLAHELDASMIALSTHGRGGSAGVAMGSVVSWVTRESPCPVLTIRPEHLERWISSWPSGTVFQSRPAGRATSTGHRASRTTAMAVLPAVTRASPVRPCVVSASNARG